MLINAYLQCHRHVLGITCKLHAKSSSLFCLIAYIPGPVIWGALIEKSCVLFQESCGKTGNCVVYDTDKFRITYYGNVLFIKLVDVVCLTVALLTILMAYKQAKVSYRISNEI